MSVLWKSEDVRSLLCRFYNRTDEEAADVVERWEQSHGMRDDYEDGPLGDARRLIEQAHDSATPVDEAGRLYVQVQALATVALVEELRLLREEGIKPR